MLVGNAVYDNERGYRDLPQTLPVAVDKALPNVTRAEVRVVDEQFEDAADMIEQAF